MTAIKAFLAKLSATDWVIVGGYVIAALTFLGGQDVLTAWGMSVADAATWSHRIATIITLISLLTSRGKAASTADAVKKVS